MYIVGTLPNFLLEAFWAIFAERAGSEQNFFRLSGVISPSVSFMEFLKKSPVSKAGQPEDLTKLIKLLSNPETAALLKALLGAADK